MSFNALRTLGLALAALATLPAAFAQKNIDVLAQREAAAFAMRHALQAARVSNGRARNIDVKRQRLDLLVDPGSVTISGVVTTRFSWIGTDRSHLYFDLSDALTVDSVRYHGAALTADRTEADMFTLTLPTVSQGYDSVTVYYHGNPPQTGFGSFVSATHNGAPITWTLSEPYGAKDWWPCKQDLEDKIDSVDMNVNCPAGNKVGSNGRLIGITTLSAGRQVYHWQSRYPITCYLVSIAVTNYQEYTYKFPLAGDSLPYQNYLYPESNTAYTRGLIDQLVPVLQAYDAHFGGYPFKREKYGHAQFGWGGGEEHQTMSSMIAFDLDLSAHELAHQWFGDKVTCGSWQDVWLNEGFATYCEGLSRTYIGNLSGWQDWKTQTLASIVAAPGGSVFVDDTTTEDRIFDGRLSYAKGAFVLHAMRGILGDSAWYAGVNAYLADPQLAYGYGRTADLKRHLEQASGKDLTEFLADYYYGQGYPSYSITYTPHLANDSVTIRVSQTPSHPSVSFFENRLPLQINYSTGARDTVYLNNTVNNQLYTLPLRGPVASVHFDPETWVLAKAGVFRGTVSSVEASAQTPLTAVPNPARNSVRIQGLPNSNQEADVDIIDEAGRLVRHARTRHARLNLEGLARGSYQLRVTQGDFAQTLRLSLEQ